MIVISSSVNNYLIGSENVISDEVQDRILQRAGRAARRVVQHKIANEFADTRSDRDSATFDDNEKQTLAMEIFNGLECTKSTAR